MPTTQTCKGEGLGISFVMPSDWSCGCQPGAAVTAPMIVAVFKQNLEHAGGTGSKVTSGMTKVGAAIPALHIAGSYHGF